MSENGIRCYSSSGPQKKDGSYNQADQVRLENMCTIIAHLLFQAAALEDLTVSAELNERIFQMISVGILVFNPFGVITKVNRDVADLFFLDSADQWIGKHAAEVFTENNSPLFVLWSKCSGHVSQHGVATEQIREPLAIYPQQNRFAYW